MSLSVSSENIETVFALRGCDENSATMAMGWTLSQSKEFRREVLYRILNEEIDTDVIIALQKSGVDRGYTDLEIAKPGKFHIIIEAKKLWALPTVEQLSRYIPRFKLKGEKCRLITVTSATAEYASRNNPNEIGGVQIDHLSWGELRAAAYAASCRTNVLKEKWWLEQFTVHLEGFVNMQDVNDNRVFVVPLSKEPIAEHNSYTWVDAVFKDSVYFHPVGNGYPYVPPNYVGFRFDGELKGICRIKSYDIVEDLNSTNSNWPKTASDHFVYCLGHLIKPSTCIRSGPLWNRRVWCAIDTLVSGEFSTIREAEMETLDRQPK